VAGHEEEFEAFMPTVSLDDVLEVATDVLDASVPEGFRDEPCRG